MDLINTSGFIQKFLKSRQDLFDIEEFGRLKTNSERYEFVHCNLETGEKVPFKVNRELGKGKNLNTALELKKKGNQAFQNAQWADSLCFYNQSYLATPEENVQEIAIIFANRSAALYHMGKASLALKDIYRALETSHYPKDMEYKLKERQARCYLALKNPFQAMQSFKETIKSLEFAKLTHDKKIKIEREAETMIQIFITNNEKPKQKQAEGGKKFENFLHNSITFDYTPKEGRFAKARTNIKVGETLVKERPHCSVLLENSKFSHCLHCFKRVIAPISCPNCVDAIFCGEVCRDSAKYHSNSECGVLSVLWRSGLSIICLMALRIISQKNIEYFEKILLEVDGINDLEDRLKYPVDDYRKIYNLFHHENQRQPDELLQHAMVAYFLVMCLDSCQYFKDMPEDSKLKIGALTLRNLQILQFNSHEVFEKDSKTKLTKFIGGALYPTVALFNHSCNPGVVRYFRGNCIHVHSVRNIDKNEMIAENYGPIYTQQDKKSRLQTLKSFYRFDCNCEACFNNWPLFDEMTTNFIRLRCNSDKDCKGAVIVSIDCKEFMVRCDECGQLTNIFMGLKGMEDVDQDIMKADRLLDNKEVDPALRKYISILDKMTSLCVPPFKDYVLCQQKIRECLLEYGNRV